MSNLKIDIFTPPTTFHGPTIGYHDLKIIDKTNIAIGFLGNATMNKIVVATTVNKDDDLLVLNVANELEHLGGREASEGMQGNKWVSSGGSACSWVASGREGSSTRGTVTSSSGTSSKMAINSFCSLHLCPINYFSSQL
jgi:hypothetical protein